ncbi:MAG: hypothetical protein WD825_09865 [Gemmatimonadaceae bacterium]
MRRILIVTLGLMATGSVIGAVLGALSLWIATAILGVGPELGSDAELLVAGAKAGALTGSVLAPISAWSLMRVVPLWRAIGDPALGTALGAILGSFAAAMLNGGLAWSILGALIGFLVAAVRLRIVYGARSKQKPVVTR